MVRGGRAQLIVLLAGLLGAPPAGAKALFYDNVAAFLDYSRSHGAR